MEHDKKERGNSPCRSKRNVRASCHQSKKRKKEARGNSLFSERSEKMAIKLGKDREKSERQKNGEKLDGARSMMKTNFSQKRVKKNSKMAEKSLFLRRKPSLLVGQKGSNPRPSPKDPKHAVFSQKERNQGQKASICGRSEPDLTEKQRRTPPPETKKKGVSKLSIRFLPIRAVVATC